MSRINRSKFLALAALPLIVGGSVLAASPAQARVGVGISLGFPPPVVVAPPVVPAPPAVVVRPPAYYVAPPGYYPGYYYAPAPGYGYFWYDRFGRRHWAR